MNLTPSSKNIDLVINKCTPEQYEQIILTYGLSALSDELFLVELDYLNANMSSIISVANGVNEYDAVNVKQLLNLSNNLSDFYKKNETSSATQISVALLDNKTIFKTWRTL